MGSGLAFLGEIGGQHHFLDHAIGGARQQALELQVGRPDAVQRRESAHQHVIESLIGAGVLDDQLVGGIFHHAQQRGIARLVTADIAQLVFGERVAAAAVPYPIKGLRQPLGQAPGSIAVALQQVKGQPPGRAWAHAGQSTQGEDQFIEGGQVLHAQSAIRTAS